MQFSVSNPQYSNNFVSVRLIRRMWKRISPYRRTYRLGTGTWSAGDYRRAATCKLGKLIKRRHSYGLYNYWCACPSVATRQILWCDGLPIRTLENGHSQFMGEIRQMVRPLWLTGVNTAEVFLSNMDYAQVGCGCYYTRVYRRYSERLLWRKWLAHYPDRFFVCGMCEFRKPGSWKQAKSL